jgi:hypothetical protein
MPFGCPFCCELRPTIEDLKSHAGKEHSELIAQPMNDDGYTFDDYVREEKVYWTVKGMLSSMEIINKTWIERRDLVSELVGDMARKELMILRIMTNLWPCKHFHENESDDCCPNRAAHHEYMMLIAAEAGEE